MSETKTTGAMTKHARRVPPRSAAVMFSVRGEDVEITLMGEARKRNGRSTEAEELAIACASYAAKLVGGEGEGG